MLKIFHNLWLFWDMITAPSEQKFLKHLGYKGNINVIKKGLRNNISPNLKSPSGRTILNIAMLNQRYDIVEEIANTVGLDLNKATDFHFTPLIQAIKLNNANLVDIFIKAGSDINEPDCIENAQPLVHAVARENDKIINLLLDASAKPIDNRASAARKFIYSEKIKKLKDLESHDGALKRILSAEKESSAHIKY